MTAFATIELRLAVQATAAWGGLQVRIAELAEPCSPPCMAASSTSHVPEEGHHG